MMKFKKEHETFIQCHLSQRSGERRARIQRGHRVAEQLLLKNVWWPMFGNFDYLHPEYEVYDFYRRSRFLDFAFIMPFLKIGLEVDGYKTHIVDMDREKFRNELNRHSFLVGLGWKMIRFAYDDVSQTPEVCKQLLQLVMGQYRPQSSPVNKPSLIEKELIRFACSLARPIKPADVTEHFDVDFRTARKWMNSACEKGWLLPILTIGEQRVRRYELNPEKMKFFF